MTDGDAAPQPLSVWAGVDAGGSHCELGLATDPTRPLLRVQGPGISLAQGPDGAAATIHGLLDQAMSQLNAEATVRAWVVGAAGAGRETTRQALQQALVSQGHRPPRVVTDFEIAHFSVFSSRPGLLLGAGTGSYAVGRGVQGQLLRVGGWGPILSDEGSGYDLGLRALRCAARELDGRAPATELSAALLGATACADLDALITWSLQAPRPALADLAREVCSLASRGQAEACQLLEHTADELMSLAQGLAPRLGVSPVPVALAGGLLALGVPLREVLLRRIQALPGAELVERPVDPVLGALALAAGRSEGG